MRKYRSKHTLIRGPYRSKFEGKVAESLKKLPNSFDYERDKLAYVLENNYHPDWTVDDGAWYLEAKGKFTGADRRKMLAVIRDNPGVDIRMVFMRNNKLSKVSKTTYGAWCDKHGIKWSLFPKLPLGKGYDKLV